jgi:AraC-like DNA-binding protein
VIDYKIDFYSGFMFLGLTQGLFLGLFFILKRKKENILYKLLGITLLLISIQIFDFFSAYSLVTLKFPHLLDISIPFTLATGPLLYFIYYFYNNNRLPENWFLHLVPVIIFFINHQFYFLEHPDNKYNALVLSRDLNLPLRNSHPSTLTGHLNLLHLGGELITLSLSIYSILFMIELSKIIKKNHSNFWKLNDKIIRWLRNFAILTCGLVLYTILQQIFIRTPKTEFIAASYLTILIYFTSFQLLQHSKLLNISLSKSKYQNSALDIELKESIKERILKYMEHESPYTNNLFSLSLLAKNISSSSNNVSQVLNELFNQSFYDFVNTYRISKAKKILNDPNFNNINIEEIGFKVGYNSKTTFYKAFKKQTGITPLQYKKQL